MLATNDDLEDAGLDEGPHTTDAWLNGEDRDPLANTLLDMAKAWNELGETDALFKMMLQDQAMAWLTTQHARLTPAVSWVVLVEVFGAAGLARALEQRTGCPLAALFAQASAHFAEPPPQWVLCDAILGLSDEQRACLIEQGFPLAALCAQKKRTAQVLDVAFTTGHTWVLDLWKKTYRKHPVFAYWVARKGLTLPDKPLTAEAAALVVEALDLWCAGQVTAQIRRMAFEHPFDPRIWAAGVARSVSKGHQPLFPVKRGPGTTGVQTDHLGWLLNPVPTAHQVLERTQRLSNAWPAEAILRFDNTPVLRPDGFAHKPFDFADVFPPV
jgi:hypothetical protein